MVHLSSPTMIGIMIFYSILTFFVGPLVTRPFMKDHPDQCIAGFLLGFTVSIFLWMKFGRKFASHAKKMIHKWRKKKYIKESKEKVILTDKGSVFADKIISDLFFI